MKNYIERTNALLKRRDEYLAAQKAKRAKIIKISSVTCSFVAVCLIGVSIWQSDLFKPKDTGSDLPEGFVQVQPNDYVPEQSQPKPDTQTPDTNTQIKEPDLSSPEDKPAVKPDNNTDTEIKQPDVSLEAITPPIVGDMTQNFSPAINYKPLEFEIDDDFSPYEVVITLTPEESVQGKIYSVSDFPGFDIYNVFEYSEYYLPWDYPQLETCTTIFLMLNEPSKEKVLEYCELLEKDERVLFARPNINKFADYGYEDIVLKAFFTDDIVNAQNSEELMEDAIKDIKELADLSGFHKAEPWENKHRDEIFFFPNGSPDDYEYLTEQIKILAGSGYFKYVRPLYNVIEESNITLTLKDEYLDKIAEFDITDFPEFELEKVEYYDFCQKIGLFFIEYDKKMVLDAYNILKSNKYVKNVELSDHVEIYIYTTTPGVGNYIR